MPKEFKKLVLSDNFILDSKRTMTDEGYLVSPASISRTGIQQYTSKELGMEGNNRIVNVLRRDTEVFKDSSINSFKTAVLTNEHPVDGVNAKNFKDLAVGFMDGVPTVNDDNIRLDANLIFTDANTIEDIENGKSQLSVGYSCELMSIDEIVDGLQCEFEQTNIKANHVALVKNGRAGISCSVSDDANALLELQQEGVDVPKEIKKESVKIEKVEDVDNTVEVEQVEASIDVSDLEAVETNVLTVDNDTDIVLSNIVKLENKILDKLFIDSDELLSNVELPENIKQSLELADDKKDIQLLKLINSLLDDIKNKEQWLDSDKQDIENWKSSVEKSKAECDEMRSNVEELKKRALPKEMHDLVNDSNSIQDVIDSEVQKRLKLMSDVKELSLEIDFNGKNENEIKKEVVSSKVNVDDKTSEYINARFDIMLEMAKDSDPSNQLRVELSKHATNTNKIDDSKEEVLSIVEQARLNKMNRYKK